VIKAKSQVVLNTLTEQGLQDAFKKYVQKGTTLRVMVANMPKVRF
jgi:hypothetical protein